MANRSKVKRWVEIVVTSVMWTALAMFVILSALSLLGLPTHVLALHTLVPMAIFGFVAAHLNSRI